MSHAKTAEPIEIPFGGEGLTREGHKTMY